MTAPPAHQDFWAFIDLLSKNAALPYVTLIGSWAEYIYAQSGLLPGFSASLRTLDIDFLIENMRKPRDKISLPAIAQEAGYLLARDSLTAVTKIYSVGGLEIEFLIAQRGAGLEPSLHTNLGVNATPLSHLHMLDRHKIQLQVFGYDLQVPLPEAYVLHKVIIHPKRGIKQEKDREALAALAPHLQPERFRQVFEDLTKAERKAVLNLQRGFSFLSDFLL